MVDRVFTFFINFLENPGMGALDPRERCPSSLLLVPSAVPQGTGFPSRGTFYEAPPAGRGTRPLRGGGRQSAVPTGGNGGQIARATGWGGDGTCGPMRASAPTGETCRNVRGVRRPPPTGDGGTGHAALRAWFCGVPSLLSGKNCSFSGHDNGDGKHHLSLEAAGQRTGAGPQSSKLEPML